MEQAYNVFLLLGGIGLFLFGISYMGKGLEQAAGDNLRVWLEKLTTSPLKAVLVGALKLCGPELEAYAAWKEGKRTAPTGEAPAEEAPAEEAPAAEETVSETTVTEEETPGPGAEA